MTKVLREVFQWPIRDACGGYGYLEQQIYPPRLAPFLDQDGFVGQQHLRGTPEAVEWLNLFGFQTVVMIRDFADSVVSLRDHHIKSGVECSMSFLTKEMLADMTEREHIDYIISHMMPWYVAFVVSWQEASKRLERPPIWINYRDLLPTPHDAIIRVARAVGQPVSDSVIDDSLGKLLNENTRFNVGREGRGRECLSAAQLAALESIVAPYRTQFDFSGVMPDPDKKDER